MTTDTAERPIWRVDWVEVSIHHVHKYRHREDRMAFVSAATAAQAIQTVCERFPLAQDLTAEREYPL